MSMTREKFKVFKDIIVAFAGSILCIGAGLKLFCNIYNLPELMDKLNEKDENNNYKLTGMKRFTTAVKGIFV